MRLCSLLIILMIFIQKVSSNGTYSISKNYPNNDKIGLYALTIPCLICHHFSLAGCLYIILGTYRRWKLSQTGKLSMTLKIPFYMAITDLLLYSVNFPNILFTLIFHKPWPSPECEIIGFITNLFTCLNMTLSLMISIIMYIRVCLNKCFVLGSYDWKLFSIVIILSISMTFGSWGNYGEDTWWCNSSNVHVSYMIMFGTVIIIGTTIFCYLNVMCRIRSIDVNVSEEDSSSVNNESHRRRLAEINYRFGIKATTYILIFIIQWFFAFPNHIMRFTQDRSVWTFILFGISVNSGGILNGIQYHINEGWPNNSTTSYNSSEIAQQHNNTSNHSNTLITTVTTVTTV